MWLYELLRWLYGLLAAASRRLGAAIERAGLALFAAAFTTAAVMFVLAAYAKPFWHDEIYTILVSQLPLPTLWRAALDGIDLAAPLNTILTRPVHLLVGVGQLTTRLPPLVGVLGAMLTTFVFLRRRTNMTVALTGALLLWFTPAREAAIEARGYGLSLGFFMLAWFAWSEAAARTRPGRYLTLMAAALALGVWSHYYFVLAFLPLGLGELVRQIGRRKIDWVRWGAFACAGVATLPLAAIARVAGAQRATFWARTDTMRFADTYAFVGRPWSWANIHDAAIAIVAIAVLELIRRATKREWPRRLAAHDVVAAVVMLALPAAGVMLGYAIGTFADRYVLFTAAGLTCAAPLLAWWLTPRHGLAETLAVIVVAHAFARDIRHSAADRPGPPNPYRDHAALAVALGGPEPVVVTGGVHYLELWYHAPAGARSKVLYLASPAAERAFDRTDTVDRGYLALGRWTAVPARPLDEFLASHRRFVMYVLPPDWIGPELDRAQAERSERARDPAGTLVDIRLPGGH